jgi:telomere length regulation protein
MEGLLTPVSTSYKSSEKPVEDALYVYPSSLKVTLALKYPHASHPATKYLVLPCSSEYIRGFCSEILTDFEILGL